MPEHDDRDVDFPVDDATYNLLQTLTSKLESLDAYGTYIDDADESDRALYQQLMDDDRRAAERLFQVLKDRLAQG